MATIKLFALRPCMVAPGRVARPGKAFEADARHASYLIGAGLARELTEAEAAAAEKTEEEPDASDTSAENRDPKVRKR